MSEPAKLSLRSYYGRVLARGLGDARHAITRAGVAIGTVLAIVAGFVQSRLDESTDFTSVAVGAVIAAVGLVVLFLVWQVLRAPAVLAWEQRRRASDELADQRRRCSDETVALRGRLEVLEGVLDSERPRRELGDQLLKLGELEPPDEISVEVLRETVPERIERITWEIIKLTAWETQTREMICKWVREFETEFTTTRGSELPGTHKVDEESIQIGTVQEEIQAWVETEAGSAQRNYQAALSALHPESPPGC